ncbi:type III pantothenate kinase [Pseudoduganella lurida]|nr:type III pantothenate kinase [Pseudoduganella lurida]
MTWLLVDAGNTRVKWALVDADAPLGQWRAQGAVTLDRIDALPAQWPFVADRVLVSNVAGAAVRAALEAALGAQANVEWFASVPARAGVVNGYRNPLQLGCDRFAAAIGAHALVPAQAAVIANCGTATTVDIVGADGRFGGGMILPGLALMHGALARNTAQLPQIDAGAPLPPVFADNTHDAILSGCLAAQAGAIARACDSAMATHGTVACIISGGAAQLVMPALALPGAVAPRRVDNIVMVGLHAALQADALDQAPC